MKGKAVKKDVLGREDFVEAGRILGLLKERLTDGKHIFSSTLKAEQSESEHEVVIDVLSSMRTRSSWVLVVMVSRLHGSKELVMRTYLQSTNGRFTYDGWASQFPDRRRSVRRVVRIIEKLVRKKALGGVIYCPEVELSPLILKYQQRKLWRLIPRRLRGSSLSSSVVLEVESQVDL